MNLKHSLDRAFRQIPDASFAIRYWDGETITYGEQKPEFLLRLTDPSTVRHVLVDPLVRLPEAYASGQVDVEGDVQRLLRLGYALDPRLLRVNPLRHAIRYLGAWRRRNSLHGARGNVSHHYDRGNEFFRLWLDKEMNYSCGYFESAGDDLETAQRQKLRHICKKLRLKPGQRLLDIGCGWGALAAHAVREFDVNAVGINLSKEQVAHCRSKLQRCGLDRRVEVRLQDYRELGPEQFDAVASVGMIEHVGKSYLPRYMAAVARSLRPGGTGVFQLISQTHEKAVTPWIGKYIFPGMYLPPLGELATEMARAGLRIIDVENLRPHYALTIDAWIERFERNRDAVRAMFDERFVRMWRLYLNAACAAYKYGELNLWQITFTHGFSEQVPLTRRYLYEEPARQAPPARRVA